jgi:hypothetical protein
VTLRSLQRSVVFDTIMDVRGVRSVLAQRKACIDRMYDIADANDCIALNLMRCSVASLSQCSQS